MSALTYTLTDSATMLRRSLKRQLRYPSITLQLIGMPVVFLLLFVYVFGGQLGAGLGAEPGTGLGAGPGAHAGRGAYLDYLMPGILLMTVAAAVQGTSISIAMDMTSGIIARFRTMAIARASVLTGHVLGSVIQTMIGLAVVAGIGIGLGFRPAAGPPAWLAAIGILVLFTFALIWLSVALGLAAKSVETASNTPMFLVLLPFLGSGFVPTTSMPPGLRHFAEYQPFTPVTETVRGLLTATPTGSNPITALAWSIAIALTAYLWARHLYNHHPHR
jgi:ABC-2 type transport system permease protein